MAIMPSLMIRLSGLLLWFDESLQTSLAKAGYSPVTRSQSMFLLCLAAGENRPSRIAAQLGISRQAVSHIIAELSRRGLIVLTVDPADARGRIVQYGFDDQEMRKAAHKTITSLEALLKQRIGPEAFGGLSRGLDADWGDIALIDIPPPTAKAGGKTKKTKP